MHQQTFGMRLAHYEHSTRCYVSILYVRLNVHNAPGTLQLIKIYSSYIWLNVHNAPDTLQRNTQFGSIFIMYRVHQQ